MVWGEEGIVGAASAFYGGEEGEGRTAEHSGFCVCSCGQLPSVRDPASFQCT